MYGRYSSPIGHNALFCAQRYNCSIQDISIGTLNAKHTVDNYFNNSIDDSQIQTASFVQELIMLLENTLELSSSVSFLREEYNLIINNVCTS